MEAIIISGLPAVGKTTVARIIGEELKLKVIGGGDILKEMAVEEGFNPKGDDWWDTDEGIKFLERRKNIPNFDMEVDRRLMKKVEKGDIIVTSYTLPWLSKSGIKIWLSGSIESRAKRMAKRDGIDEERCKEIISIRDRENYKIYKKLYNIDFGKDLKPFHLLVETDAIDEKQVSSIILHYVRNRCK